MAFFNRINLPDVPVHGPDTEVLWTKSSMYDAAQGEDGPETFIRGVAFVPHGFIHPKSRVPATVTEILEISHELNTKTAIALGHQAVPHTFGVYEHPHNSNYRPMSGQWLPSGYSFVAEVHIVADPEAISFTEDLKLQDDINSLESSVTDGPILIDLNPDQFIKGKLRGTQGEPRTYYADIEPRLVLDVNSLR